MVVGRGWGRGARQLVFNGHRVSVWEDENGDARWWWLDNNRMYSCSWTIHLKMVKVVSFTLCILYRNFFKKGIWTRSFINNCLLRTCCFRNFPKHWGHNNKCNRHKFCFPGALSLMSHSGSHRRNSQANVKLQLCHRPPERGTRHCESRRKGVWLGGL